MDVGKKLRETLACTIARISREAILFFPILHVGIEHILKCVANGEVVAVEVDMKHRIRIPVLLQRVDGKSAEQLLLALEVILKRRHKEALSESTWSTEKVNLTFCDKTVYQCGFVHIYISVFYNSLEVLNTDRKFHKL